MHLQKRLAHAHSHHSATSQKLEAAPFIEMHLANMSLIIFNNFNSTELVDIPMGSLSSAI